MSHRPIRGPPSFLAPAGNAFAVEIDEGAAFPEHEHPHEQIVSVIDGTLELTVDGTTHALERGAVFVIPPHVLHKGRALTPCRVLDAFAPGRDDYR